METKPTVTYAEILPELQKDSGLIVVAMGPFLLMMMLGYGLFRGLWGMASATLLDTAVAPDETGGLVDMAWISTGKCSHLSIIDRVETAYTNYVKTLPVAAAETAPV